jgi:5'-nucleotidase
MSSPIIRSRRKFISTAATLLAGTGLQLVSTDAICAGRATKLTILHTNDTHSHIDPFPDNDPAYPGMGGVARRAAMIRQIRTTEPNVLLLDSGDIYQGTPYFNKFGGSIEFDLMTAMGYDAATMGNHDFDIGLEGFLKNLPRADFPFLCANYEFTNTIIEGRTKPYQLFEKDGIRAGVFGIGIELHNLVEKRLYKETRVLNAIEIANDSAALLRHGKKCDLVICLSHLGYHSHDKSIITDERLARETKNIDLILGGHSHTFLDTPVSFTNREGVEVLVAQTGFGGIRLGRIDVHFTSGKTSRSHTAVSQPVH